MEWLNIYPARVRIRSFHIESKKRTCCTCSLYSIILCPESAFAEILSEYESEKKINIISLIPALQ